MKVQVGKVNNSTNWAVFQEKVAEYVRLELAGEPAAEIYPEIAFYIENSPPCEEVYQREFRRQGLAKSFDELQNRPRPTDPLAAIRQVFPVHQAGISVATSIPLPSSPTSTWYLKAIDHGQAWVDRLTERWRQVELTLPTIHLGNMPIPQTANGFLDDQNALQHTIPILPEGANFELMLSIESDPANDGLFQLEAIINLFDRFGDFSGVEMTLRWGNTAYSAITDTLGRAIFSHLPVEQLATMRLQVNLPE